MQNVGLKDAGGRSRRVTSSDLSLKELYRKRFSSDDQFRAAMWKLLCEEWFQRFVPADSCILEVGAGHCEFINAISARKKIALDVNPDTRAYAADEVAVLLEPATGMSSVLDESIDRVFMSNLLEHLERAEIIATLEESYRCLDKDGQILILQPNIRYLTRDYWMFADHITPVDDRAVVELLELIGFRSVASKSRFLPYTTKGRLPNSLWLLRLYLRCPWLHPFFGKQAFIVGTK